VKALKHLFSDTLIYGISSVLARFINYLLVPLHTGLFDPEAYGIVGLVYAAIGLLQVVFTFGMESAYLRYGKEDTKIADLFSTIQRLLLLLSIVATLLLWLAYTPISAWLSLASLPPHPISGLDGASIFACMLAILIMDALAIVPFAELRLRNKALMFAGIKLVNVLVNLGLNVLLILVLTWGIEAIFVANLAASLLSLVLVFIVTRRLWMGAWSAKSVGMLFLFAWPFIPSGLAHVVNETLDRFFLKSLNSQQIMSIYGSDWSADYLVGVYNACYKLAVFMLLLVQMYRMAWQPFFMRESEGEQATELFAKAFNYFNIGAAAVFLFVALFLEWIVAIPIPFLGTTLIDQAYWSGLGIVPWLLMAYWFQGWYVNFSAGVFIREKTKHLAQITGIGAAVTIILNVLLIRTMGMEGAALATLGSYSVMAFLLYRHSQKAMHVPYNMVRNMLTLILSLGLVQLLNSGMLFTDAPNFWGILGVFLVSMTAVVTIQTGIFGYFDKKNPTA
jgi:O-antigen/teichoic acid export membrane protein